MESGEGAWRRSVEIARDLVRRVAPMVAGVQLSAPFGRYELAVRVAEAMPKEASGRAAR